MQLLKELPRNNRPREKALLYGISSLSDVELLALIIRNGTKTCDVFEITNILFDKFKSLFGILSADYEQLINCNGINKAKALELKSIFEMYCRINKYERTKDEFFIKSAHDVYEHYKIIMQSYDKEVICVLYLSIRNKVLKDEIISIGTDLFSYLDVSELCRNALLLKARKVIIIHNHPSGDCSASEDDYNLTISVKEALSIIKMILLDHIIIGKNEYFSIIEDKKIKCDK